MLEIQTNHKKLKILFPYCSVSDFIHLYTLNTYAIYYDFRINAMLIEF